jgi:excisionase family DNA binding protein
VSERLLKTRELADLLGFSMATIQDWVEAGSIPAFKPGGRLRFRLSEVETWLESKRASAGGEVSATPSKRSPRGVVSHLSATPRMAGGEDA